MSYTISITVDVEDWYHIPSVTGSPFSVYKDVNEFFEKWKNRYDYLSEPTKRILDLLDDFNIKATFFVVADITEHYPGLVESIVGRGHEIGCHGLNHACKVDPKTKKPLFVIREFEKRTLRAKEILEEKYKEKIIGYRAPNGYVSGWMLDSLENIGFTYDSSVYVNSLYNKSDSSLKGVSSYPYYPKKNDLTVGTKRELVEFPLAYWNILNFKLPATGGPMLRFLGRRVLLKGLKQSLKRGPTVFYYHPIDISPEKFPRVGKRRPLYWIIKGKIVENRIRSILSYLNSLSEIKFLTLKELRSSHVL